MKNPSVWWRPTLVALLLVGTQALAEDISASPDKQRWCQDNPQQCEEKKAKRAVWCQENPERCEKAKARHAEMRKQCEADPVACEQRKQARRERREAFRKQCEDDPVTCEKKREEMKQRRQQRREADADKPTAESAD